MDNAFVGNRLHPCSQFYFFGVFKAWGLLNMSREGNEHYGEEEPLFYNMFLGPQQGFSQGLIENFFDGHIVRVRDLLDLSGGGWRNPQSVAQQVGLRSMRTVGRLLEGLKASLPRGLVDFIEMLLTSGTLTDPVGFPVLKVSPKITGVELHTGCLLTWVGCTDVGFNTVGKKLLYHMCVKIMHLPQLKGRPDTKWRSFFSISQSTSPSWRMLYKSPIPKRAGDLQWCVLHCAMATGVFTARLRDDVSNLCTLCNVPETVFHGLCKIESSVSFTS